MYVPVIRIMKGRYHIMSENNGNANNNNGGIDYGALAKAGAAAGAASLAKGALAAAGALAVIAVARRLGIAPDVVVLHHAAHNAAPNAATGTGTGKLALERRPPRVSFL